MHRHVFTGAYCRLLGTTDIQLGEVISKGNLSVERALKGKSGEQLTVSLFGHALRVWIRSFMMPVGHRWLLETT
jgi:sialic acid synthase SpsE